MYEVLGIVALTTLYVFWRNWRKVRRLRTSGNWPVADGYIAQIEDKRDDNGFLVVTLAYTYKVADQCIYVISPGQLSFRLIGALRRYVIVNFNTLD
jgi:hypothetical protein